MSQNKVARSFGTAGVAAAMATMAAGEPATFKISYSQPLPVDGGSEPLKVGASVDITEQLLNAKLDAVEARTETKFAQLLGEMKLLGERISTLSDDVRDVKADLGTVAATARATKTTIIITVITTGVAVALGAVGLAYTAVGVFASGMGVTASAYQAGMAAAPKDVPTAPTGTESAAAKK